MHLQTKLLYNQETLITNMLQIKCCFNNMIKIKYLKDISNPNVVSLHWKSFSAHDPLFTLQLRNLS